MINDWLLVWHGIHFICCKSRWSLQFKKENGPIFCMRWLPVLLHSQWSEFGRCEWSWRLLYAEVIAVILKWNVYYLHLYRSESWLGKVGVGAIGAGAVILFASYFIGKITGNVGALGIVSSGRSAMVLLTILKKLKQKEKEMRLLML